MTNPSQEGNLVKGKAPAESFEKSDSASHQTRTGRGASWKAEYTRLAEILQSRNYAPKIVTAYTRWVRKFQAFTRSKAPESLSSDDVRMFLTALPLKRKMSISKQNQVFDALLFFYRHMLKMELEVARGTFTSDPYIMLIHEAVIAHSRWPEGHSHLIPAHHLAQQKPQKIRALNPPFNPPMHETHVQKAIKQAGGKTSG